MAQPIENYIPPSLAVDFRRQAVKVWGVASLLVFAWVFVILLAPVAKANGFNTIAAPIYAFFSYICHQMSTRSFHVEGEQFAVCSRCFGVYLGLLAGFLVYPLWRKIDEIEPVPRFWLFLSMIPIAVDWSLGVFGIWENTHLSRFITGLILGVACATFLVPGLVEVTRNLSRKLVGSSSGSKQ